MSRRAQTIEDDFAVGDFDSVLFCIWRNETSQRGIETARRAIDGLATRYPTGIGMIVIVEKDAVLPGPDERAELSALLKHSGHVAVASALVFEGEGLRATAVRSLVTGLSMLARQPYPHRVFSDVEAAARWIAPVLGAATGSPTTSTTLAGAVDTFRKEVEQASS